MNSKSGKNPAREAKNPYAALGGYKLSRKDKYAWVGLLIAIVLLLLAWWARGSQ